MTAGPRTGTAGPRPGLWRHRDFGALWAAHTVSQFGTQISYFAVPVLAVVTLEASKAEIGLLTAAESLPFLLLGLPAGVWVDRWPRRTVLITADLLRAALLAAVPVAGLLGLLDVRLLIGVMLLVGSATVFFDIAYQAYLPGLVGGRQVAEGNTKLEFSRSTAELAGPGLGGLVVQLSSAVLAVCGNVLSYLGSAALLALIRRPEEPPPPPTAGRTRMLPQIHEGLRHVFGHPTLRALALCTATANLFGLGGALSAVLTVHAVQERGLAVGALGLALTLGNAGALLGAALNARLVRRLGLGPVLITASLLPAPALLLLASAGPRGIGPLLGLAMALLSLGATVYNINQVSLRQVVTPARLQGRMNASMRFVVWGTLPLGALLGGLLSARIGTTATLWTLGTLAATATLPLLTHPVRTLRELPHAPG